DGERVKPAHIVRDDALVTIRRGGIAVEVVITACSDRRGSAQDAALLYRETEASIAAREREAQARRGADAMSTRFPGRPTKRNRRKLEDFLNEPWRAARRAANRVGRPRGGAGSRGSGSRAQRATRAARQARARSYATRTAADVARARR